MEDLEFRKALKAHIEHLERRLARAKAFLADQDESGEAGNPDSAAKHPRVATARRTAAALNPTRRPQNGITHRQFLRDLIARHEPNGIEPKGMIRLSREAGRSFPKSYPYEQIADMKKDGEVKKVGQKYRLAKELKSAAASGD